MNTMPPNLMSPLQSFMAHGYNPRPVIAAQPAAPVPEQGPAPMPLAGPAAPDQQGQSPGMIDSLISKGIDMAPSSSPLSDYIKSSMMGGGAAAGAGATSGAANLTGLMGMIAKLFI